MRVPISWLSEYVDITLPVADLAEKLTIAGLEVTAIEYIGIPGGSDPDRLVWEREKLVMGQILEVAAHPDADRLVLATVAYGADETEVVVTGAPNLFEYLGRGDLADPRLYSPFALEGAVLYDGHQEGRVKMKLKGRKLRGIYNRCMLCSEKELGLSDEHEGILILQGDYTPGTPVQDVLGDAVLDIDIIPNIARCASILGVAREVAALTGKSVREPDYNVVFEGPRVEPMVTVTTERPDLNPRFVALVIQGVQQKPSPAWMQRRLRLAGQRPINVVVDVSNYVMLEMGQPNHTFDYDFLRRRADVYDPEGPVHIHTRLPLEGERLTTLDGETHDLPPHTILVTDTAGSLSLGGIMGGLESEIGEGTRNVLLEAAAWNYINLRQSMSSLKMHSEAAFRFSRGVHPSQALLGARRAAELLRRHAGGTIARGIIDHYPNQPDAAAIALTTEEVRRIGGIEVTQGEIAAMLRALHFEVQVDGPQLLVTSPDFRLDIEGSHDLIEEVCRIYGYDRIPSGQMTDTLPPQRTNLDLEGEERIRDFLVDLGLQEVITYRLTTPEREARLLQGKSVRPDERPYVTIANPISLERVAMRHSQLNSLLEIVSANSRYQDRIALFELGHIYLVGEEGILPDEPRRLSLALGGLVRQEHWQPEEKRTYDFYDLKGIAEEFFSALHLGDVEFEAAEHPTFRPGRTARVWLSGRHLGWLGEVHPLVIDAFEVKGDWPVIAAELDADLLIKDILWQHRTEPVPAYPAVHEDIALIVDRDLPEGKVRAAIASSGGFLLRRVRLFDVYEGGSIPPGKRSLAYHLTFQSPGRTLTDKEVRANRERIVARLSQKFGAQLRDT
jgi:phenylalanyl-tRNA synthetase beta chain